MTKFIDNLINSITMYRLILYGLIVVAILSIGYGFSGLLPYSGLQFIGSIIVLVAACNGINYILSKIFNVQANVESASITALILFFLFIPIASISDFITLLLASLISMSSKYLLALNKKHIFNPAAIAAFILGFNPNTAALWWVGNSALFPIVLVVGLLVVRKIRKFTLFFTYLLTALVTTILLGIQQETLSANLLIETFTSGPLIFLGTIMLTEPLTMPPRRNLQIAYGVIVAILSSTQYKIGPIYSTPEFALIMGNIFSYFVSPKAKIIMQLKRKIELAYDTYEFIFKPEYNIKFKPGQYFEWTLAHRKSDSRGVRRYFTVASSPTEDDIRLGVRYSQNPSTFKKKLLSLTKDDKLVASQLSGDFVLPEDQEEKLVFIAGGIGITPFRSMIKYVLDMGEKRSIILIYLNKNEKDIAYTDILEEAKKRIDLKTIYVLTGKNVPDTWKGEVGRLNEKIIKEMIPDYNQRTFYLSGPNMLVQNYKEILLKLGISRKKTVTDYFPGF